MRASTGESLAGAAFTIGIVGTLATEPALIWPVVAVIGGVWLAIHYAEQASATARLQEKRDELAQEMAVAVCAGTLPYRDIRRAAPNFLVAFNRANRGKCGDLSLDAPLYANGHMTLGDRIASDAFHF